MSFVEFPGHTVLGVLDLEAGGSELVADFVAGGPVLVSLGLGTEGEHHVDNLAEGFLAGGAGSGGRTTRCGGLQAEDVESEEVHYLLQLVQAVGTDGGLVVDELIDGGAGLKEVADDLWRGQVVVHGIVALLAQGLHHLLCLRVTCR